MQKKTKSERKTRRKRIQMRLAVKWCVRQRQAVRASHTNMSLTGHPGWHTNRARPNRAFYIHWTSCIYSGRSVPPPLPPPLPPTSFLASPLSISYYHCLLSLSLSLSFSLPLTSPTPSLRSNHKQTNKQRLTTDDTDGFARLQKARHLLAQSASSRDRSSVLSMPCACIPRLRELAELACLLVGCLTSQQQDSVS